VFRSLEPTASTVWSPLVVTGTLVLTEMVPEELAVVFTVGPVGESRSMTTFSLAAKPCPVTVNGSPTATWVGETEIEVAAATVSVVVPVEPRSVESPEYVAVTVSVPTGALADAQEAPGTCGRRDGDVVWW